MCSDDAERVIRKALENSNLKDYERPKLLSDNAYCYLSGDLKTFIEEEEITHVR